MSAATDLLATFTDRPAAGEWSAPGRVNLIGEHTDYNDGFVLPFAIEHRTSAAVALREDDIIRVATTFADAPVEVALADLDHAIAAGGLDWAAYPLGVAWALRAAAPGASPRGVDIAIASDVPVGAGLSSSAAIEGAVAAALSDVWAAGLDRVALARVGRTAENDAVGAPTGIMDQMATMLGEADAATFLDCRSLEARPVDLGFTREGLQILVIDTLVTHAHASGGYGERRASCEAGARAMGVPALRDLTVDDLPRAQQQLDEVTFRRVRHIVTENQRVLDTVATLDADGPRAIGDLLTASHASMRDDFEISVPELDLAVETALKAGALGARMTGGGFGGAAIALLDAERVDSAASAVAAAFEAAGFRAPRTFTVTPSAGARRDA
ncbi:MULTISPECIES: galactokinase [Microbacterium]|uniref:Galactokinase n=1 Tax=Microbacterium wangchenii TaxID=2541726 RepID=A0ABX5SY18_9MICO|nr:MULTISPECIES: galactokinase [Microbacterium]MCK6065799.1 galactokinase [Microbacterium sp. EYE_512]QBR90111.1 galactokinase [Microbacterium wangchenii]TFV85079.1 galactokinase [Microbacterium sp. dk485]TXK11873.1 galactokinase [Microbacterium wangchenii]